MHPFLLDFGRGRLPWLGEVQLALPSYGLLVVLSIAVGWFWLLHRARRAGLDPDKVSSAAVWALFGGILGGKLGLVIAEADLLVHEPGQLATAEFLRAGGVIWTAVLGGLGALIVAARRSGLPAAELVDAAALPLPVSQAIGRVGCFLAGCCYGGPADWPWAVTYSSAEAHARTGVPLGTPLHPAPLYEALWNVAVVFPVVALASRRRRAPGEAAAAYVVVYGLGRALIEFTRADAVRGLWLGGALSTSQILSLLLVPAGALVWLRLRRRPRSTPAATRKSPRQ